MDILEDGKNMCSPEALGRHKTQYRSWFLSVNNGLGEIMDQNCLPGDTTFTYNLRRALGRGNMVNMF